MIELKHINCNQVMYLMVESEDNIGFKEMEDGLPVYFTQDQNETIFCEGHRLMLVKDLYKTTGMNKDLILGRREARFYHFFKQNKDKAYTVEAFVDTFFGEDDLNVDIERVESLLLKMRSKRIINGAYSNGYYYFHF